MDRDAIFSAEVCRVLRHMEVRPVRTSFQSPWQNGVGAYQTPTLIVIPTPTPKPTRTPAPTAIATAGVTSIVLKIAFRLW